MFDARVERKCVVESIIVASKTATTVFPSDDVIASGSTNSRVLPGNEAVSSTGRKRYFRWRRRRRRRLRRRRLSDTSMLASRRQKRRARALLRRRYYGTLALKDHNGATTTCAGIRVNRALLITQLLPHVCLLISLTSDLISHLLAVPGDHLTKNSTRSLILEPDVYGNLSTTYVNGVFTGTCPRCYYSCCGTA